MACIVVRRRRKDDTGAKMTMLDRFALRGRNKDDLLRSDIKMNILTNVFLFPLILSDSQ